MFILRLLYSPHSGLEFSVAQLPARDLSRHPGLSAPQRNILLGGWDWSRQEEALRGGFASPTLGK